MWFRTASTRSFRSAAILAGALLLIAGAPLAAPAEDSTDPEVAPIATSTPAPAATPESLLSFALHATAFSQINHLSTVVDPEVFVQDPNAPATTGYEGIAHLAGLRPARLADDPTMPLFDAQGIALGLSLGHWRTAEGSAHLSSDDEGSSLSVRLHHLVAFGHYRLFLRADSPGGARFIPIGDDASTREFFASGEGNAHLILPLPATQPSDASLVVIYESDDVGSTSQDDGSTGIDDPGTLGSIAHTQLEVALP